MGLDVRVLRSRIVDARRRYHFLSGARPSGPGRPLRTNKSHAATASLLCQQHIRVWLSHTSLRPNTKRCRFSSRRGQKARHGPPAQASALLRAVRAMRCARPLRCAFLGAVARVWSTPVALSTATDSVRGAAVCNSDRLAGHARGARTLAGTGSLIGRSACASCASCAGAAMAAGKPALQERRWRAPLPSSMRCPCAGSQAGRSGIYRYVERLAGHRRGGKRA